MPPRDAPTTAGGVSALKWSRTAIRSVASRLDVVPAGRVPVAVTVTAGVIGDHRVPARMEATRRSAPGVAVLAAAVQEQHDGTDVVVVVVVGGQGDPVLGPDPMLHDGGHDAFPASRNTPERATRRVGAHCALPVVLTIVTVPCATQTALSPLVMSIRATPLRLPSDTMSATATHTPLDTGLSKFSLNSVVATHDPAGMTG